MASNRRTSCEPGRCSAYSEDLRWRMVYQYEARDLTCDEVGANLCVDPSTVSRTVQLFRRTGHVSKKQYDTTNLPLQLTESIQILLLQIVLD